MNTKQKALESLNAQLSESERVRKEFFARESEKLVEVARLMGESIGRGGKLLICGNGGSASDSLHFSGEMIGRFMKERRPLPALAIPGDVATLTAIGNDYGYDQVFTRTVEAFGKKGDLFFGISTSGKSPNVLKAAQAAKALGLTVIGMTGGAGGPLGELADVHLNVALGKNSARIQEVHIQIIHLLVDLMDEFYLPSGNVSVS